MKRMIGMDVEPGHEAARLDHGGKSYLFCNPGCKDEFARNPGAYLKVSAPGKGGTQKPWWKFWVILLGAGLITGGYWMGAPASTRAGEHPEGEHPGEDAARKPGQFSAGKIKEAMKTHIEKEMKKSAGALAIRDDKEKKDLRLVFVRIHDPVRKVEGRGYFACTEFKVEKEPDSYDLDFWLKPKDGKLAVTETLIHKENGVARFTYDKDKPVEVK